jgi:hypothetical protein
LYFGKGIWLLLYTHARTHRGRGDQEREMLIPFLILIHFRKQFVMTETKNPKKISLLSCQHSLPEHSQVSWNFRM